MRRSSYRSRRKMSASKKKPLKKLSDWLESVKSSKKKRRKNGRKS